MRKLIASVVVAFLALSLAGAATAGTTEIVSVNNAGKIGNSGSINPSVSANGRYVAFESSANNLVHADRNGVDDIFVRDRMTGVTERVSVSSTGGQSNDYSHNPSISADGRYVAFESLADDLVRKDTNRQWDIFVHDWITGETERVSVSSTGEQGDGSSYGASISADGRYVAFFSHATNLVPNDTNNTYDVFVHDRVTGVTQRVSVSSTGEQGYMYSFAPSISADGRYVAFHSDATLAPNDVNMWTDVYVHDRQTGQTTLVSISSAGEAGDGASAAPSISADGRYVAFWSDAANLVPNDTNWYADVFVHDRDADGDGVFDEPGAVCTIRVSVSSSGAEGNYGSSLSSISADGRSVAFESGATNLVPDGAVGGIFVRDLLTGVTERVSVSSTGEPAYGFGGHASISADGRYVAFYSVADNLVAGDTNGAADIFVRIRW